MTGGRADRTPHVAEMQGLAGPFSFPERLLQKIWLRRDFDGEGAVTTDGRRLQIVDPGKWNLLGGPDFRGARLRFDRPKGADVCGDVEVHLHARDWDAHGHARDPAYDRVVLHVVLFPPPAGQRTLGAGGRDIPVLALLPLLPRGIEEFAADDAVENLANRGPSRLPEELVGRSDDEIADLLQLQARVRWRQKVRFAALRIGALGWADACHHAGLEVLGFRFNRAPMLRIAGRWPLSDWARGRATPDQACASESGAWSLQGVRPANHPLVRLRQYAGWVQRQPDWPEAVRRLATGLPELDPRHPTAEERRRAGLAGWRARMMTDVVGGAVGGTRLDALVCDGLLPLAANVTGASLEGCWFHWFPGDLPGFIRAGLRQLGYGLGRMRPLANGLGQGLLGCCLAREITR